MKVNMYLTAAEAEKAVGNGSFTPLPVNDYILMIDSIEQRVSRSGRPGLNIKCSVINDPKYTGRIVFYSCPLPWINNGEIDASGGGFLISLFKGIGMEWKGTEFDTDDLIGQSFKAHVIQKPRVRGSAPVLDTNGNQIIDNDVKKIYRA